MADAPKLPPLPEARPMLSRYTKEQMLAYGAECRRMALEEAARVCEAEHLEEPQGTADDIAYGQAVDDCISAIRRAMKD